MRTRDVVVVFFLIQSLPVAHVMTCHVWVFLRLAPPAGLGMNCYYIIFKFIYVYNKYNHLLFLFI